MPKITIKVKQPKVILPFNGDIDHDKCYAVRLNYRLHIQCTNSKEESSNYCKICQKGVINDIPVYGDIRERAKVGLLDYVDPKGKSTIPLYNAIKHFKFKMEDVIQKAKELNYFIPEVHFEKHDEIVEMGKRGRPKKDTVIENGFEEEKQKLWDEYKDASVRHIDVKSFYHKRRIYLKSQAGGVFDIDTEEFLGLYNPETDCIESKPKLDLNDELI